MPRVTWRTRRNYWRVYDLVDDEWASVKTLMRRQECGGLRLSESSVRSALARLVRVGRVQATTTRPMLFKRND